MTLVITLVREEGVFQSIDYRVTKAGRIVDDLTPKQLAIHTPPLEGGPRLLLAFTGLAEITDGTPMIQWIRETLRGESRSMDATLKLLRDRLDRDVARSRYRHVPLVLSGGILEASGRRLYVGISNVRPTDWTVQRSFGLVVLEVEEVALGLTGSGARWVSSEDRLLLQDQARRRPRKWEDHLGLLAAVNRRTADRDNASTVSPWSLARYMTLEPGGGSGRIFSGPREPKPPLSMEMLFVGIDLSFMTGLLERAKDGLPPLDPEEINRQLRPRP